MMSPDQLDNWFTYHPPTDETAPKYLAVRRAEADVADLCATLYFAVRDVEVGAKKPEGGPERVTADLYAMVNTVARALAEAIDAQAPDSADKTAAIRCVRLARNALNETIAGVLANQQRGDVFDNGLLLRWIGVARDELTKARWQANSAIACEAAKPTSVTP